MQRVIILGCGGHAQVVADILLRMADAGAPLHPVAFLDDDPARHGRQLLGLPVAGRIADLGQIPHDLVIIGIGSNATRRRLFEQLLAAGERFATAVHPSAILAPGVTVGAGSVLCAGVIVNTGSAIGANVIVNTGSTVDHHNLVADHAHLAPGVHTGGDVTIDMGAFVGIGATVMPQRRVGAWSTVGAAGLVQRDVSAGAVVVGVPAREIRPTES